MNKLKLINLNGIETIDSKQVADVVEKPHNDLLKDIRKYCEYLGEGKISHTDFFIESTYITKQNKEMPCYLCTRKTSYKKSSPKIKNRKNFFEEKRV